MTADEMVRAANAILIDTTGSKAARQRAYAAFVYEHKDEILDGLLDESGQVIPGRWGVKA